MPVRAGVPRSCSQALTYENVLYHIIIGYAVVTNAQGTKAGSSDLEAEEIDLELIASPDDPDYRSSTCQHELENVDEQLRAHALKVTPLQLLQKSADGVSGLSGTFLITVGPAVVAALGVVVGAWIQGRLGRKVKLKIGDVEAEARTPDELRDLLAYAARIRPRLSKPDGTP
jgi:hypothetical protein